MINKIFPYILLLGLSCPAWATQIDTFGKDAGAAEIVNFSETLPLCTKLKTAVGVTSYGTSVQFNDISTNGCKLIMTGLVSGTMPSYSLNVRLYYTTSTQSSKVVELGVRAYAVTPYFGANSGIELNMGTTQVTMSSGTVRNFVADQRQFVEGNVTIKTQDGSACTSDCDNTELVLVIEPTSGNTMPNGALYFLGYSAYWAH